jgi:hypothetical protein
MVSDDRQFRAHCAEARKRSSDEALNALADGPTFRSVGLAGADNHPGENHYPGHLDSAIDWDTSLAPEEAAAWTELEEELPLLEGVRVPRWFRGDASAGALEIHGFSDASERAYAAQWDEKPNSRTFYRKA